jgi:hypothetical protein
VHPRAGLDAAVGRKIPLLPLPGINPGRPALNLITVLTELPRFLPKKCELMNNFRSLLVPNRVL